MSETNVTSTPSVNVSYIVTNNCLKKACPVLTINVGNNENIKFLQIPNNEPVPMTLSQPVLNLPKSGPNEEFTITNSKSNIVYRVLRPEDLDLKVPTPELTLKPVKRGKQKKPFIDEEKESNDEIPKKVFRTRSGRMSKPPKHIRQQEDLPQIIINMNNPTQEKTETAIVPQSVTELIEKKTSIKPVEYKRNISSQFRCVTCKKAYLGQNKMLKHLQLNPGHVGPNFGKKSCELNLWPELLRKTKEVPKNQQSNLFCKELINLIQKARYIIPKLLKPAQKQEVTNFTVDSVVSNALGIPEGNYCFDETVSVTEIASSDYNDNKNNFVEMKESEECFQYVESDNVQNNDQNSLLNLLDTGQVTFDSSATTTEEVMNVDQLVNERLKSLTGGELESPNNGTQNLSLDLSLDMFSYQGT